MRHRRLKKLWSRLKELQQQKLTRDALLLKIGAYVSSGIRETVTEGYRKIATVISADLYRLGQLRPENKVRFLPVSPDEARSALLEIEMIIRNSHTNSFGYRCLRI